MTLDAALALPVLSTGSAVVTRLLQTWYPTPLERAQLHATTHGLDLQWRRIAMEDAHHQAQLRAQRESVRLQMNGARINVERQIQANQDLEADRDLARRWPQQATAAASIVRTSRAFGGTSLNAILRVSARADVTKENFAGRSEVLSAAVEGVLTYFAARPGRKVLVYDDTALPHLDGGDRLVATVSSLTASEPCCLIEISVGRDQFRLSASCWGWGGDRGPPEIGATHVLAPASDVELARSLQAALITIIAAADDRLQTVTALDEPPAVRSLELIAHLTDCRLIPYQGFGLTSQALTLSRMVVESHSSTLMMIAEKAPRRASEAAGRAAIDAQLAGRPDLAQGFVAAALAYFRQSLAGAASVDETALLTLVGRTTDDASWLHRALVQLRNASFAPPPPAEADNDHDIGPGDAEGLRPWARRLFGPATPGERPS